MAMIKRSDIIEEFKKSLEQRSKQSMPNTYEIAASVVSSATFVEDRMRNIRDLFNNNGTNETAARGGVFRKIFAKIDSGRRDVDGEENIEYTSSGTKDDNNDKIETEQKYSADTISRNRVAYDIANIQVEAVIAQTVAISTALSDQKTYLSNINTNIEKIVSSLNKGMDQMHEDLVQSTATSMYNEKGYLDISKYLGQVKDETAKATSLMSSMLSFFKDPKNLMKQGIDSILDRMKVNKFFENIEDSVSKGFTNMIDNLGNSKLLRANNPLSKALRSIFIPNINGSDIQGSLSLGTGISGSKPVPFDNITRQTIIEAIPGLLERILAQNEIVAKVMQGSTGIKASASGITYDVKSGRFVTARDFRNSIKNEYKDIRKNNTLSGGGEIDLSQWKDAIEPMIFFMATMNLPIKNFWKMPYSTAKDYLLWGLGTKRIPKNIESQFNLFWNAFHSNTETTMTVAQRKAIEEINRLYYRIKESIDKLNIQNANDVATGVRRSDQLETFEGWYATEIARGKITNFDNHANRNGYVGGKHPVGGKNTTIRDTAAEFVHDISESVKIFGEDLRKLVHAGVEQEGSIYVHDSVAIEYLKALTSKLAPGANIKGISTAEDIHRHAHTGETRKPSLSQITNQNGKTRDRSMSFDTSYADDETIDWQPDIVKKGKYRAMEFAQGLGYHGFDSQLKNNKYANKSSTGMVENLSYKTDIMRANAEIDYALHSGKISTDQADELRAALNNSSPDEYKRSLIKTIARWSPAVIGGLAFGPFGFLAGLGIKRYISKTNAEKITDKTKKMEKDSSKSIKAKKKMESDRKELEKEIQNAYNAGKLSEEERDDALKALSTMDPNEYKSGLTKWALKLGPAVAASLLGFGPLGVLVGAVIGKKLTTPSAVKIRKSLNKIKPRDDVWDDEKREKLIKDLNAKIDELNQSKSQASTQEEKDSIESTIVQLEKYKADIMRANRAKLAWYVSSIPGVLSAIWNIRKLPGLAIRRGLQGMHALKKGAKNIAGTAWTKIKDAAVRAYGKIFYGDIRITTDSGREQLRQELRAKLDADEITQDEYNKAMTALDDAIQKYDSSKRVAGAIGSGIRSLGKVAKFAGGILTGRTHKNIAAKANRSAAEATKFLNSSPAEQQAIIAQKVDNIATNIDAIASAAIDSNSLNVSDSGVKELLVQILAAINPNADLSRFRSIEQNHAKNSPNTITTSKISVKMINGKKVVNGKEIEENNSDNAAIIGAITTAANIDDIRDKKLKNEFTSLAMDSASKPESKRKIAKLFNKTYQNLTNDEEGNGGSENGKSGGIISKITETITGDGKMPNLNGGLWTLLLPALKKIIPAAALGFLGIKSFNNMNKGFSREYNENVETRENVVNNDMRNGGSKYINAGVIASQLADDFITGSTVIKDGISSITSFGKSAVSNFANSNFAKSAVKFASSVGKKFTSSKGGQQLISKASKIKNVLTKFLTVLKENKFLKWIFKFMGKAVPKSDGKIIQALKKLFSPAKLKSVGRGLVGVGFVLEVYANVIQQLENSKTNFSAELDAALSSGESIGTKMFNVFKLVTDNFDEAVANGGDGFVESILNAIGAAGINVLLSMAFAPYAIIKLALTISSIVLDFAVGSESNPSSIKYFTLKTTKYLVDDILNLDDALIQSVSETLVDILGAAFSLLSFNLTKIISALKELVNDLISLLTKSAKHILYIGCDLILLILLITPILNGATITFIKRLNGGDALLSLRKQLELLLTGKITFGEFCGTVLGSIGQKLKDALGKIGETFVAAKDWVVDKARGVADWAKSSWNKLIGNGKGRFGRGLQYGYGGDLYQENPMYINSRYNMFDAGCGPIALTAALRQQGIASTPTGTASMLGGFRDADGGTHPEGILSVGNKLGGKFAGGSTDVRSIINNARSGKPVVMMGQDGAFGDGMHYMTAVGVDGNELIVRDPLRPDLRRIHPNNIQGNVTSAIYGKGRAGMGGRSGRGFLEFASTLGNIANGFESKVGSLLGSIFGGSFSGSSNDVSTNVSPGAQDPSVEYVDYTPRQASGDQKSINGQITYPKEMCKDPGGSFPNSREGHNYGQMIRDIKDLLIGQYKYTLILPSVIACIMRGETEFGKTAHEKNLGNIMGHGFGTKDVSNNIKDRQLGHVTNYEAYNYWGESIYRIGHLLSHNNLYHGAVGNTDTLSALSIIGPRYAQNPRWASDLYGFWSSEHMNTLKQYDREAINTMQKATVSGNGRGRGGKSGRGFFEFMSKMNNIASGFESKVSGVLGSVLGLSHVDANTTPVGDDRNINSAELNASGNSGGSRTNEPGTKAITKGSAAERVLEYLKQGDPNTRVSLGFQGVADGLYTASDRHTGIDFAAAGGTNIYSPVGGTISRVVANITNADGPSAGGYLGNNVQVKDSSGKVHWFAHMLPGSVGQFSVGDVIKAGDYIGKVGTTGRSTGYHLHYQVNNNGNDYYDVIDPNSVTGMGRYKSPRSNINVGNPNRNDLGMGGSSNIDYNITLEKIYNVLLEIAKNTNVSFDHLNFGNGRGSTNRQQYQHPRMNRSYTNPMGSISNPVGVGYQRLVRGYA